MCFHPVVVGPRLVGVKGKLYSPVTRGEDRSVANRGHHLQAPQAQRHSAFSRFGENKRLTPENLEKKRLQTIAAYQFMTPDKPDSTTV
ncbi:unnamed protein product [Caretta caretta]